MFKFNDFRFRVAFRVVLLGISTAVLSAIVWRPEMLFASGLIGLIIVLQLSELFRFVSKTNRKLTRFLESVKYSDFISGFTADNSLGSSFKGLNIAFNEVLEAFRKARSEREEHWQYLNTVVEQVRTGLLSFDAAGNVQLINANARRYMSIQSLRHIDELLEKHPRLHKAIFDTTPGNSTLYKGSNNISLTIQATEMRIRGTTVKLVTLQNIQPELQRQEIDAWQNLTRVLRHEIMNSITPISSITSTLKEIIENEMVRQDGLYALKKEGADDLRDGLETIDNRSRGLIRFIDAYREYTSLPQPKIRTVRVKDLVEKVAGLMKQDVRTLKIDFKYDVSSEYLTIQADPEMIEQVLINLVKNAMEAASEVPNSTVSLTGSYDETSAMIEVEDNGPGIIREALEHIFVPFYTTKKGGSGIGLSLSRQIMQLHNGTIEAESEPEVRTVFRLRF